MFISLIPRICLFLLLTSLASYNAGGNEAQRATGSRKLVGESPFKAKASFIRYWKKQVSTDIPKAWFLNKASPLDGVQLARFSKLADQNLLSTKIDAFCSEANLLCYHEVAPSLSKNDKDVDNAKGRKQDFKPYTDGINSRNNNVDSTDFWIRYGEKGINANDISKDFWIRYGEKGIKANDVSKDFWIRYGDKGNKANDVSKDFWIRYGDKGNKANDVSKDFWIRYSDKGNKANDVSQDFWIRYGDKGNKANDVSSDFWIRYGDKENKGNDVSMDFWIRYGQKGIKSNDVSQDFWIRYGDKGNKANDVSRDFWIRYGENGIKANDVSKDFWIRYDEKEIKANDISKDFWIRYGEKGIKANDVSTDVWMRYGEKGITAKDNLTLADYKNDSSDDNNGVKKVINRWVEPGKFFREEMLKAGNVMPMPDIRDKTPKRSFLPRFIASKLPISSSKVGELYKTFRVRENSSMSVMIMKAVSECEREPSTGESKRCVGSHEDMIDFATSVLGRNVVVQTTENTHGSRGDILIGSVRAINGGKLTKSVSCHQRLFPYLLHYCHSVPNIRVYEVDILDPKSKTKINNGVAICHIDTSSWSPSHEAFIRLGRGPGKIEVCHWIFENDLVWTIAD